MIRWNFIHRIVVLLLLVGIVTLPGFGLSPQIYSHLDVEESARHGALKPVDALDHSHSHDDGEDYEQKAGHSHAHDPADHSHQVVLISHTIIAEAHTGSDTPLTHVPELIKLETDFGIDRPPKGAERA